MFPFLPKKKKEVEQIPLYLELEPTPKIEKKEEQKEEQKEERGIIIIDIL